MRYIVWALIGLALGFMIFAFAQVLFHELIL